MSIIGLLDNTRNLHKGQSCVVFYPYNVMLFRNMHAKINTLTTTKIMGKKPKAERTKRRASRDEYEDEDESIGMHIRQETRYGIYAIITFVVAVFFILAAFASAGPAGTALYTFLKKLVGIGYILVPAILVLLGVTFLRTKRPDIGIMHAVACIILLVGSLGIIDIISGTHHAGGYIGFWGAFPFLALFGTTVSILFLAALFVISLIFIFDERPNLGIFRSLFGLFKKEKLLIDEVEPKIEGGYTEAQVTQTEPIKEEKTTEKNSAKQQYDEEEDIIPKTKTYTHRFGEYTPPPIDLLERDKGKPNVGDIKANTNIIKRTLQNFGIEVEMDEVTVGPTVTRYALKPAEGVKLSKIVALKNDLGLALAAHPLRIEAPIPGKSLVGIEIPNRVKSIVGLATLLEDPNFRSTGKPLMVALGRNIAGRGTFASIAKMPHGLIAGATGSGKSVAIHAVVTSLLYTYGPEELKFLMIDPKRVELTLYNKIPHLLTPVITDAKKAILALKWAAKEMEKRYNILEGEHVRDIASYHEKVIGKTKPAKDEVSAKEPMPYIVVIIDELADIMQAFPRELESAIVRLAQMSRAVGIHLILSTQRPSVNVVTGLIKANIPTRIALQVASQIDSRTILDQPGAESLLGAGDMLYLSGEMSQPERLQSAFISEDEVKKVVKYLADAYKNEVTEDIALTTGNLAPENSIFSATLDGSDSDDDDLYEEARQIVIETGKASTSFLQRKLGIGYARAARLIDILEERGVVGPGNGAKPRDVLEKSATTEHQEYV